MQDQKRIKVIDLLKDVPASDFQEKKDIQKIIKLVEANENIFIRDCLEAHLTGSALVINPETKQILLHNHKKLNKWLQFGGHADGESDLSAVAFKEAGEETGLGDLRLFAAQPMDIEVQTIPENKGVPKHLHLDFRYLIFTLATEVPTPEEHESQDLKFFSFEEVYEMSDKLDYALIRLVKKAEELV